MTEDEKRIVTLLFSYAPELMEAYALAIKLTQIFNTHLSKDEATTKLRLFLDLSGYELYAAKIVV